MLTVRGDTRYRRAPRLALTWEDDGLRCVFAETGASCRVSADVVRLLDHTDRPMTVAELAQRAAVGRQVVLRAVETGLLEPETTEHPAELHDWGTFELAVQRRTGLGRKRTEPDRSRVPPPLLDVEGVRIPLRPPERLTSAEPRFAEVLASRRSRREFGPRPLSFAALSELLTCASGLQTVDERTGTVRRPFPSGGSRHSLELYVAAMHVEGLERSCYYFEPVGSLICVDGSEEFTGKLEHVMMQEIARAGVTRIRPPAAVLLVTSVFARTFWKYQDLGLTLVHKDVGCLYQTLYLQAVAQGLGGFAVGGGPEATFARALGLDPLRQSYVGAFVLGTTDIPREGPSDG
jgi:SagB-type dehydrogenase family enzyme